MKRVVVGIAIALVLIPVTVMAETSILIDFTALTADTSLGSGDPTEHGGTMVDYSGLAGSSLTDEEKELMRTSLAMGNWEVVLASSARTVGNQERSFTREAVTNQDARSFSGEDMANRSVLGIRVHFPEAPYNSWAMVRPPFEIPAFGEEDPDQFVGFGVVKNVGVLKEVQITVYGSNFPNGLAVVLEDADGNEKNIFMDYLTFDGWRTLRWLNPNYVTDVRNREVNRLPLYPKSAPFYKLKGIVIYRDAAQEGGDFITYVKDLRLTYDTAILPRQTRDIDDEAIWGILQDRQEARKQLELRRLGDLQVLRYLERLKMHQEEAVE
jgi:hypothetical protein